MVTKHKHNFDRLTIEIFFWLLTHSYDADYLFSRVLAMLQLGVYVLSCCTACIQSSYILRDEHFKLYITFYFNGPQVYSWAAMICLPFVDQLCVPTFFGPQAIQRHLHENMYNSSDVNKRCSRWLHGCTFVVCLNKSPNFGEFWVCLLSVFKISKL